MWYQFQENNSGEAAELLENEEDYYLFREELITLFLNLARLDKFLPFVLSSVSALFQQIVPGTTDFREAEVPLLLMCHLHMIISKQEKEKKDENNAFFQLAQIMINVDFLAFNHRIITLMFLENLVKYSPFFMELPGFIGKLL